MKELLKKKSTKAALLLIVVAVIAGIAGMNVQSAQKEKEYNAHLEAAEKYLTELNYEQAIAEYTLALAIEPNAEEVLNGLEKTYLAYADSLADAGEYEKAIQVLNEGYAQTGRESLQEKIAQIQEMQAQAEEETIAYADALADAGEYEKAIQVLNEGYAQTGRESLQEKLTQIQEMQTPIELSLDNITIFGYGMESGNFEKVLSMYPTDDSGFGKDASGQSYDITHGSEMTILTLYADLFHIRYSLSTSGCMVLDLEFFGNELDGPIDCPEINLPIRVGDTYEDWCRVMQVDSIKEKGQKSSDGYWEFYWSFKTSYGEAKYSENLVDDGSLYCNFESLSGPEQLPKTISVFIEENGRIFDISILK